ncbi:MAG: aminotransferase class V-fold PLP-dependent enzyme, partial [Candidatus Eremiobacteraeota bacterium]|nr:aminotransferase class V-fold PLP-dependent enzyme [Candidatus Eremiobacteraeota bacterium]
EAFERALRADTTLASIMWANNELGTLQPVRQLAAVARRRGVVFHTDAVQLPAYARIDVDDAGVDLLSISAHKFYGPKGVGALYVRSGTPLLPLVLGGSQEFAKRAGTENVAGIVGMAVALELATAELPQSAQRIGGLRDRFEATIVERISGIRINGRAASRLPNVSNVSIDGIEGEALVVRLDLEGVAVSSGSACASGSLEPSHVIAALGLDPRWQRGVVRFSFGRTTTDSQVDRLVDVLDSAVARLRAVNSSAVDV